MHRYRYVWKKLPQFFVQASSLYVPSILDNLLSITHVPANSIPPPPHHLRQIWEVVTKSLSSESHWHSKSTILLDGSYNNQKLLARNEKDVQLLKQSGWFGSGIIVVQSCRGLSLGLLPYGEINFRIQ